VKISLWELRRWIKKTRKIAVITGCSKEDGVGYNTAKILLEQDYEVIATVRDVENNDLVRNEITKFENLNLQTLDLCSADSIKLFIEGVLSQYNYIDVLINNAANVAIGSTETLTQEDLLTTFQTKVFGPVALIQGFLRNYNSGFHC